MALNIQNYFSDISDDKYPLLLGGWAQFLQVGKFISPKIRLRFGSVAREW